MKLIRKRIALGDDVLRHTIRLESDECQPGEPQYLVEQHAILRSIVDNPDLLVCGPVRWQRATIFFDGKCWVVEADATVTQETPIEARRPPQ